MIPRTSAQPTQQDQPQTTENFGTLYVQYQIACKRYYGTVFVVILDEEEEEEEQRGDDDSYNM